MIYFDTDVLINLLIRQNPEKHQVAKKVYEEATQNERFFISVLCLQEMSFVLKKLEISNTQITDAIDLFLLYQPVGYSVPELKRAFGLSKIIGFQHVNDCLHTAIAEMHCDELYTFNRNDFKKLGNHSALKITIL